MFFAKTAILLEWIRIFVPQRTRNMFFLICCSMIIINCGLYTAGILSTNFGCTPRDKLWYTWLPGKCINRKALDVCSSVFNLICDFAILLLPQKVIWNLQLRAKRKIGISVIFSVGVV